MILCNSKPPQLQEMPAKFRKPSTDSLDKTNSNGILPFNLTFPYIYAAASGYVQAIVTIKLAFYSEIQAARVLPVLL